MARRPDAREAEMLSKENLAELRNNLAHLSLPGRSRFLRAGVPRLPSDLQPTAHAEADPDAGSGVEAVVEVALSRLNWFTVAVPQDQKMFALSSVVVREGLAFVERRISAKLRIKAYDNWPEITWSDGMPDFILACIEPPINYKDAFNSRWLALSAMFGRDYDIEERFDFDEKQSYQHLKRYFQTELHVAARIFPSDVDETLLNFSLKSFLEDAIDRYIHLSGYTSFDSDRFLEVYLPLEAGLLLEELPIEIHTPILLVGFPSDSYDLGNAVSITRISEPMQLARARRDHDSHDVNEYLLQQASHALVLREHFLPNPNYRQRLSGYTVSAPSLDTIDTFFACLRIVTSIETGYAQVLFVPLGWAFRYTAYLPPLEGLTMRKYPPNLRPVSTITGDEFPKMSDRQVESVRDLFVALTLIQSSDKGRRLRLVIKRLNSCYMREEQEDAILDATIGLEILLSDGDTQEVTHKLALRLAALSTLVPEFEQEAVTIFRNVKKTIYPFRSGVVHGDEKKANISREAKTGTGAIPAVKLAVQYLGMAVQAVAAHPEYLDPRAIDDKLLLGRAATRSLDATETPPGK